MRGPAPAPALAAKRATRLGCYRRHRRGSAGMTPALVCNPARLAVLCLNIFRLYLGLYSNPKQGVLMSRVIRRQWASDPFAQTRRERRSCEYEAYVPDQLTGRRVILDGDVAADVTDAETSMARLDSEATALVDTEALARILLRAESVASSRIEGLEIGPRRLLRAEAVRSMREPPSDPTATEVLGNIDAMLHGVESVGFGDEITVDLLLE